MRRPLLIALLAVIVALGAATAVLFQKSQQTSASFTDSEKRYNSAIDAIAEIQDSLNAIVVGDTTVAALSQRLESEQGLTRTQSEAAMQRISVINASIQRTKVRINDLETRLEKSGIRVASLTRMVNSLKRNVSAKEEMIAGLSTRVDSLQTAVAGLQSDVQAKQDTITAKDQTIEERRRELATVFYVVGTRKDLQKSGVLVNKGGVLGLGKTAMLSGNYNESLFTPIDTDQQTTVDTPAAKTEKVKVISPQATSSYELTKSGDRVQLHILDPVEFRKVKHLVIITG
jgi:peptidoglycan hydrolase CwlO-like protein